MANEIISFFEMCAKEGGASLQGGMYFRLRGGNHSVALMSVRTDAPYADRIEDEGETLIYEGHNVKRNEAEFPQLVDQPMHLPSGNLTQNGKFYTAAKKVVNGEAQPERVRVYEKLKKGMWIYNGVFHLVDSWIENDGRRNVFKFKLIAVEGDEDFDAPVREDVPHARVIPTAVKIEVWNRDAGKCTQCGASDDLHFDHILPYAKGGTSLKSDNIQLLCARHNLEKSDRIV
jgi:hypothetical protein